MKKVVYIISDINKAIAFEWIACNLNKKKIKLFFIFINCEDSYLRQFVQNENISLFIINFSSYTQIFRAIWECIRILKYIKADIVHCHLFYANIIGLVAAKIVGVRKRIHTRHYSDYHHVYFPNFVKYDKFINFLSTDIIAISEVVRKILIEKEKVNQYKIKLIYHGFNINSFENIEKDTHGVLSTIYNKDDKWPVIGVISRFTELKGVQYIIPAFKKILYEKPNALLLLFNASGDYEKFINKQLEELPITSYKKVMFENDITSLYHLFDIFIHVPINPTIEAFGQTYIECLASGIPIIATKSGIANEILFNQENAIIVDYQNSEEIYQAILLLLSNPDLCDRLIRNGKKIIEEKFQLNTMIEKLENLYLQ